MIAGILLSGRCLFVVVVGERKEEGGKREGARRKDERWVRKAP